MTNFDRSRLFLGANQTLQEPTAHVRYWEQGSRSTRASIPYSVKNTLMIVFWCRHGADTVHICKEALSHLFPKLMF